MDSFDSILIREDLILAKVEKMILVGDSGSTKTDWRLINGEQIQQLEGKGLNPHFHDRKSVNEVILETFRDLDHQAIASIFIYGSGCSTEYNKQIIRQPFQDYFKAAQIHIHHDLLGAARAACQNQKGIAAILGTGSNLGLYDGDQIVQEFRSGGYSIGDEGGGVNIGRKVLKAYIEEYMPEDLLGNFTQRYQTNYDEILTNLYKKPFPNRYIAQYSRFAYHHKSHPFVSQLLIENFEEFIERKVKRVKDYEKYSLSVVGSVGFYFREVLEQVCRQHGIHLGSVLEKPIAGLTLFHQT